MQDYKIFIDTSADIDPDFFHENGLGFVPMNYTLGNEDRLCETIETQEALKEFYDGQRKGLATQTSQIPPDRYLKVFGPLLKEGTDILYLSLSSGLTKTYDNVMLAKEELEEKYPGRHVCAVDSQSATGGIGLLAERAVRNKNNGMDILENEKDLNAAACKICLEFMVDDLMYLKRGGRIPASTAVLGTMLNIKPIMFVNNNGALSNYAKKRGEKAAMKDLLSNWLQDRDTSYGKRMYICHGDCIDRVNQMKEMLLKEDPELDIAICQMTPVIGAHVGPGMMALLYYGDRQRMITAAGG